MSRSMCHGDGEGLAMCGPDGNDDIPMAETAGAVEFAVRFMEGFEDDPEQEGVVRALNILRRAHTLGYRLVRAP